MKGMKQMDLASTIRNIPDFPKAGIQFKDITTLLKNKDAFRQAVDSLFHLLIVKKWISWLESKPEVLF